MFNGIRTRDLRDTGAMLYQLNYEATHWERGQFIEFIPHFHLQPQLKYELFHVIFASFHLQPQLKYELFHVIFASFRSSRDDMNSINWPRDFTWFSEIRGSQFAVLSEKFVAKGLYFGWQQGTWGSSMVESMAP